MTRHARRHAPTNSFATRFMPSWNCDHAQIGAAVVLEDLVRLVVLDFKMIGG